MPSNRQSSPRNQEASTRLAGTKPDELLCVTSNRIYCIGVAGKPAGRVGGLSLGIFSGGARLIPPFLFHFGIWAFSFTRVIFINIQLQRAITHMSLWGLTVPSHHHWAAGGFLNFYYTPYLFGRQLCRRFLGFAFMPGNKQAIGSSKHTREFDLPAACCFSSITRPICI